MSPRKLFRALGVLAVLQGIAIFTYVAVEKNRDAPFAYERIEGSRSAPELSLEKSDGSVVHLSAFRGKPVLLHFWATWCPPCRAELPKLLELSTALPEAARPEVLAVSTDGDWNAVRLFFSGQIPPAVLREATGTEHKKVDVSTLPETFLVAPDGKMTVRFRGARDWSSAEARGFLDAEIEKYVSY